MRKFKCIGLGEAEVECWSSDFVIGNIYYLDTDVSPINTIRLITDDGLNLWVDKDQFEEVKDDSVS